MANYYLRQVDRTSTTLTLVFVDPDDELSLEESTPYVYCEAYNPTTEDRGDNLDNTSISFMRVYDEEESKYVVLSDEIVITDLLPSGEYYIYFAIDGDAILDPAGPFYTLPEEIQLELVQKSSTTTSITLYLEDYTGKLDEEFGYGWIPQVQVNSDVYEYKYKISSSEDGYRSTTFTITGLSPGKKYLIAVFLECDYYTDPAFGFFSTVEIIRPEDWSWSISNSGATATATQAAYTAITTKGSVSDFKYTVWNDMVAKTAEFLEYLGDSNTAIGTNTFGFSSGLTLLEVLEYAEMDSTKDGRTLTATRFNALNCVICKITSGTGIAQVVKGGSVCGWYFTTLMTTLNSIT